MHGFLADMGPNPKWHRDRFSRFWATVSTVCKTVRPTPMLADRCLSVCVSVCLVTLVYWG